MAIFPKAGRPLARPPGTRGARARPPLARAAANGPARAAPARSRPREAWLSLAGVSASGLRELGPALPRTAAQQGGPRLRPETAKPRAGRAPIWGESRGPRPSMNSAPRTPPGASHTGSVWSWAAAASAWLGTGLQGPRGSGKRPSHPNHVGGGVTSSATPATSA